MEQNLARLEQLLEEQENRPEWTTECREDFQTLLADLTAALERHVGKEEGVLFPALEAFLPRDVGPLSVLRGEHSDMRELLRLLQRTAELRSRGDARAGVLQSLQTYGDSLIQIVRDHAYKEERVLFPMVARFLSADRDAYLLRQIEERDRIPAGGPGCKNAAPRTAPRRSPSAAASDPGASPSVAFSDLRASPSVPFSDLRARRSPMVVDTRDLVERLKLEVQVIEMGGYQPSVRDPRSELHIFRDSVSCPNLGLKEKVEPCTHCFLMEFVPPADREKDDACHYIPLNERGDTVKSLEDKPEKAQAAVLAWLKAKIAELEG